MPPTFANIQETPDLLRRFVELPYRTTWQIHNIVVKVETNDEELSRAFVKACNEPEDLVPPIRLKAVVDPDLPSVPGTRQILVDASDVLWGRSAQMFFALDREMREATIFMNHFSVLKFTELLQEVVLNSLSSGNQR